MEITSPMHVDELPLTEPLGYAANANELAQLLERALEGSKEPFQHLDRAVGGDRSIRIVFQAAIEPYTRTSPLRFPMTAREVAEEFFRQSFLPHVRLNPPNPPTSKSVKGWEVRRAKIGDQVMIIVRAAWTH